jgi:transcriptional regulator with GAF, ATPase, and Fis domain
MTETKVTQRLAAILAADVVGYSRLMQDDDRATVAKLDESRLAFREAVSEHQGRIESMAGDAILAVFDSAIGAVEAAVKIQRTLGAGNQELPDHRKMNFRIGVHLGDIIEKPDGTVYGDGVNIAARLETLSDPGGIAVSSIVRDSVGRRVDAGFDHLGEHVVKNIAEPVRAYRVLVDGNADTAQDTIAESDDGDPKTIVFTSPLMQHVLDQAGAVAETDATVLIEGESGVGKELLARYIHSQSKRRDGPFIKVDCAAIPPDVFEQEFFGLSARSLPGMERDQLGRLEAADRGTLFLDHVADIPAEVQAKLLRPLQDSTFERLGDNRTRQVDVRFVAASARNLNDMAAGGGFRRDLYFRLSVFPIVVPPLRSRSEDIPVLVSHFLDSESSGTACQHEELPDTQMMHLQKYDWPGNVRELKNLIERAVIISGTGPLKLDDALPETALSFPARAPLPLEQTPARGFFSAKEFEEFERNNLVAALESTGWQIAGPMGAASALGMGASRLRSRMKALEIARPEPDSLYARLGGNRGIATFVRELFGRAVAHPVLGRFWKGRSTYGVLREEKLLVAYLSAVTGGPANYVGRDMVSAHAHLSIQPDDWAIFEDILETTLEALSVPEKERNEVVSFAESLKGQVVG